MSSGSTFERRVTSGLDDVEQLASGKMSMSSSDLELVDDAGSSSGIGQRVGIRFTAIDIPQGATITAAYIQFQGDEVAAAATSLVIRGEHAHDAAVFANVTNNVSSRATTDAAAAWNPAAWATVGEAGLAQRTSDLSAIVQEIVARPGWLAGNDVAFVITGTGTRTAEAFESSAAKAPLLHIEYASPSSNAPVVGSISIDDVTITEGDAGPTTATFTVSRTGTAAFTVDFATADGTASAGSDYVATSNTLTFAAGERTKTVSVTINGDTTVEGDETFYLNLFNASNGGTFFDSQGVGTVTNDDAAPPTTGNHAPTGIPLSANQVTENVAGAIVGTLSASDPDAGDTHTFSVSDSRFEVVGSQLKLKDGVRLDYEVAPRLDLAVSATDQGGLALTQTLAVNVGDVAEVRFAAFGDYGYAPGSQRVADLVKKLNVDFIVCVGDNVYGSPPIDDQIGRYYSDYIGNYTGAYGTGSATNRFFSALGDNDY